MKLSEIQSSGTDFFLFFGIHQVAEIPIFGRSVIKKFKPGGFQEFIDIEITENDINELLSVAIQIDRHWLGNLQHLNPFGIDIAKSFLKAFTYSKTLPQIDQILEYLTNLHGEEDEVITFSGNPSMNAPPKGDIRHFILVTVGTEQNWSRDYGFYRLSFVNLNFETRTFLEISLMYQQISPTKQEKVY
jgi:hypothetical protein